MLSERERKMINQQRELERRQDWHKNNQQGVQKQKGPGTNWSPTPQLFPTMSVAERLNDQIVRAEPHVMTRVHLNRKRSRTLEVPSQSKSQARAGVALGELLEPSTKLRPLNMNLHVPQETRRRANTGPDSLLKPATKGGADRLHKGITFQQDTAGIQHMSSKRRGKLPFDNFVLPGEKR